MTRFCATIALLTLGCIPAAAAELTVAWTDNSSGMASFRVERRVVPDLAFTQIADVPARTTAYRDTAVVAGATHCYRVKAYDFTSESAYSGEACASAVASTYTLTVGKTGTGGGVVSSQPAGILCGTACAASFANGSVVTVVATPAAGSIFSGWSGSCTGTGPCTVAGNASISVRAQFSTLVGLSVARSGSGTVTSTPSGILCGSSCQRTFANGSQVTLTATPVNGFRFAGWSGGGCSGLSSTCTVRLSGSTVVSAIFQNRGAGSKSR